MSMRMTTGPGWASTPHGQGSQLGGTGPLPEQQHGYVWQVHLPSISSGLIAATFALLITLQVSGCLCSLCHPPNPPSARAV